MNSEIGITIEHTMKTKIRNKTIPIILLCSDSLIVMVLLPLVCDS